ARAGRRRAGIRLERIEVDTRRSEWRLYVAAEAGLLAESLVRHVEAQLLAMASGVKRVRLLPVDRALPGDLPAAGREAGGDSQGRASAAPAAPATTEELAAEAAPQADPPAPRGSVPWDAADARVDEDEAEAGEEDQGEDEGEDDGTDPDDEYIQRLMALAAAPPPPPPAAGNGRGNGSRRGASGPVLLGREFSGEPVPLSDVAEDRRPVIVAGEVMTWEARPVRGGYLISFDLTDYTDSITVKAFARSESALADPLPVGTGVRVRGRVEFDRFARELVLNAEDIMRADIPRRVDDWPEKRVELHLHTKMSSLDGAADTAAVIRQAAAWGHPAVAITDHGVVHAFPEAYQAAKAAGIKLIYGIEGYLVDDPDAKSRSYHIVILAKNRLGLRHLYELVSLSHLHYFYRNPRIPRHELEKRREGLIIGSACEAGELYQSILNGEPEEQLLARARFYDYLEIQPVDNNRFLIDEGKVAGVDGLRDINRRIVELGRRLGKPVVATSDAHFIHPEDEIFRRILMAGHGFSTAERPTPLYLRTTREMLEEFAYLGEEMAREVVIVNPNWVAAQCEDMEPVPPGLHTPELPEAPDAITRMARERARRRYGDPLPELVAARVERELKAIVENGYAPLYYIAHKLVRKSLEDGYLVGSRGSVGSSLVATLCDITEVNPLPPHYVCPACQWSQFFTDGSVGSGVDLPDKPCPRCGAELEKDGFDIPFETFMGFHGDKVPDIDLNFSGEYQAEAHRYAEELLGKENVYRAGTTATLAERTAFGYVKKFLEAQGREARTAEINRLVRGCSGVRRTTGQHPGGLIVVPRGRDIHEFTPVQYPANDRDAGVITTHFDFSALHDNLVKLDILGHDDPTMLRMLQDLTGVDVRRIPLDDPKTMAIFSSTETLGLPDDGSGSVGTLGIPEFGTRFVRQMLEETRPKTFAELVRISGLSHGTNVWTNNAQDLIRQGIATLPEVIATRDDIMTYLIQRGMDAGAAFRIMEQVRKGKGLKPEDEELMRAHGLPQWYIDSCQKISYMFPKAHAAAYVMMAFRIAYFKVHYPEAFYAAYFSVRAEEFDAHLVAQGREAIRRAIDAVERKGNEATAREKSLVTLMEIVLEAMARGIRFRRVDVYESDPKRFQITPQGLLPPLMALQGVGAAAAEAIAEARAAGPFTSMEDLRRRARLNRSVVDTLRQHGSLDGLPETDQLTLF
ncbi:MAG: PolC-type DNA polymerase III, partial [Limnochordales bacterium]